MECVLTGSDAFVIMPGRREVHVLSVAGVDDGRNGHCGIPLIALMKNQVDAIRGHHEGDSIAHFLNSSLSKAEAAQVREDAGTGLTKLLYVAPESLTKEDNINFLRNVRISFVAVDEAHCIPNGDMISVRIPADSNHRESDSRSAHCRADCHGHPKVQADIERTWA